MTTDLAPDLAVLAVKAARAYQREDLADRVERALARYGDRRAVVAVVGEFKQGKSSLVNALVGAEVCPVDDDVSTVVPTVVGWSEFAASRVSLREGSAVDITVEDLPEWVTEVQNPGNERGAARVDVGLPSPLLELGLVLVDTAGAGGLGSSHGALTMAMLPLTDAVVFATGSTQELTRPEMEYLRAVHELDRQMVVVETKIDLQPQWRLIVDVDRAHLADEGVDVPVVPVSSELFVEGALRSDDALNTESGVPALLGWLLEQVAGSTQRASVASLLGEVRDAVAQLNGQLAAERDALESRDDLDELFEQLETTRVAADRARSTASKWGLAMGDAFSDLNVAVENDLRDRLRALTDEVEALIQQSDPSRAWADIERELYRRAALATASHCTARHRFLDDAVARVDEVFEGETTGAGERVAGLDELKVELPRVAAALALEKQKLAGQGLTLVRGSYGGLAMLGFLGGFTGVTLAAPVLAGLGVLLGGRGLKEERRRQLAQRRAQARSSVRKYLDDLSLVLGRESRDTLRFVHRAVRDHYAARSVELQRTATEASAAAKRAMEATATERDERLAAVQAELVRVDRLLDRVDALAGATT